MITKNRTFSIILVVLLVLALLAAAFTSDYTDQTQNTPSLIMPKQTIYFWYTDEDMTDYVESAAVTFYEKTDIRVVPVRMSGLEYIENIYDASISNQETIYNAETDSYVHFPDVYVVTNDLLEKAYLSGTACEINDTNVIVTDINFSNTALRAVTCRDKIIGYPMSYETSLFLYNKTYLEDYIIKQLTEEQTTTDEIATDADGNAVEYSDETDTTTDATETTENTPVVTLTEDEMNAKIAEILPKSISEILDFANKYDAPEGLEALFRWDVTDIFYNYFFIGASTNVGGINGDDADYIDIYNEDAIRSLKVYQNLNNFFAIDTEEISYEDVLEEFIQGKILYSVVTTDAIKKLEDRKADGSMIYDYGMMVIPSVSEDISAAGMSVTSALAINGFSKNQDAANAFAKFLVYDMAGTLYSRTNRIPATTSVDLQDENLKVAAEEYSTTVPVTKMIEASNYWMQLEIVFTKAWAGDDTNALLKSLSEQIMTQVTGQPFEETYIPDPVEDEEYQEYSAD